MESRLISPGRDSTSQQWREWYNQWRREWGAMRTVSLTLWHDCCLSCSSYFVFVAWICSHRLQPPIRSVRSNSSPFANWTQISPPCWFWGPHSPPWASLFRFFSASTRQVANAALFRGANGSGEFAIIIFFFSSFCGREFAIQRSASTYSCVTHAVLRTAEHPSALKLLQTT